MAEEEVVQQKKDKQEECPAGAPAWMTTYSDLVTLLMTFFVLLLSMASMDPVRFTEASSSLKDAFGIHKEPAHVEFAIPILPAPPVAPYSPVQQQSAPKVYEKIQSQIESMRLNNRVGIYREDDDSIILRINDSVLFEPGRSRITPQSYSLLRTVADIIRPLPVDLRLEGHTDDRKISESIFSNWDLSVDRSVAVLRFFTQSKLLPLDRMSAVGYGRTRPLVANTSEEQRAKNRRVDFHLKLQNKKAASTTSDKTVPF